MKKTSFLISSFQKALNKPKTATFKDFILCYRNSRSGFIFADKSDCNFAPYFLKNADINKLARKIKSDIKHNSALNAEADTYNHYFRENIVIEQKSKKYLDACLKFELGSLSRQSAQIKCVAATIFPIDFFAQMPDITKKFTDLQAQISQCFKNNQNALKTNIIDDFLTQYEKIINHHYLLDIFFPQNKKILRRRVREIISTLRNNQPLPADFADESAFHKPAFVFDKGENYRAAYVDSLLYLSEKIMLMKNYDDLLELAYKKVQQSADFAREIQYFHNANYSPDTEEIVQIKTIAQNLYDKFAKLCYFKAIAKSFEIFYAADYPFEQNSALPTVAPDKEIQKIEKIVERAKTISAKGKLAKEFRLMMSDFSACAENLQTALDRFNNSTF